MTPEEMQKKIDDLEFDLGVAKEAQRVVEEELILTKKELGECVDSYNRLVGSIKDFGADMFRNFAIRL